MLAYYGYKDGSGEYFITIDTSKCAKCDEKPCVKACPQKIVEIVENDYEEEVVGIVEEYRNQLKFVCTPCKSTGKGNIVPCIEACFYSAITHSW